MSTAYQMSKPVRLGTEVHDILLKRLMPLEIRPDDRISVDKLARDLGVSQTPIREALSQPEIPEPRGKDPPVRFPGRPRN